MAVETQDKVIALVGKCPVDDAERLFTALEAHPDCTVDLSKMTSLHTAVLQVLMARNPRCGAAPEDPELAWIKPLLTLEPTLENA